MTHPSQVPRAHPALVEVAAALGSRDESSLERAFRHAAESGLAPDVEEVLITALFVIGFPATLAAWETWAAIREVPPEAEEGQAVTRQGIDVFRDVYGTQSEPLRARLRALNPDLEDLILRVGYGEMMGRGSLPLSVRETCLVAMLTSWGAWRQLYSHLRGGLRCGVPGEHLLNALEAGIEASPTERRARIKSSALEVWSRLTSRDGEETSKGPSA